MMRVFEMLCPSTSKWRGLPVMVLAALFGFHGPDCASAGDLGFEGRIEAVERSDVYSRAEGIVEEVLVAQGDYVEAGTPLLWLRNDLEKLAVDAAISELAKAEALLDQARDKMERAAQLSTRGTATEVALFEAETNLKLAEAETALVETELKVAQTNYDDTFIRAPISGHVEDPQVGPGSLVEFSSGDPPLFQIVNLDRLRVVFEIPYAHWVEEMNGNDARPRASSDLAQFRIVSETGAVLQKPFTQTGSAVWVDDKNGKIRVWADLENPNPALLPGLKVRVTPVVPSGTGVRQNHSMVRP
ncbi:MULTISPECIES: efflux RND transporter periplasmic adaptor subunit [unclassified Ruegeria]|uniref:efflux RND transporter periplasmic adaptor subunit n=2 Tax=Ruegeria TaxID=97050 RepID=UPI001489F92C|nr:MULTISPECIES: efflux RND transporter periplasmic adaptor subunit [unclassified Ruegeria]NOD74926.1 efflux RND transporter periplasmic adaptor subunit [Ruegeria sp. HKCCD4332]NOE12442.1 efflux RND transporter periplasmic adaptor subunit [Ruegeria sp. HKCCD4318-2]NOG09393.1 efflux RND transporter periplasmic adaptor subunit [Ruegeria sp. HKCCD4315]